MTHKTALDAARARLLQASLDTGQQYGGDRIGWFIEVRVDDLKAVLDHLAERDEADEDAMHASLESKF
jgi:hypothetical protein